MTWRDLMSKIPAGCDLTIRLTGLVDNPFDVIPMRLAERGGRVRRVEVAITPEFLDHDVLNDKTAIAHVLDQMVKAMNEL